MKITTVIGAAVAFVGVSAGYAQDKSALIEKLKSKDADEADNAREDLLKMGVDAIPALREAASKSADEAFKKAATSIVERLQIRQVAPGLAQQWGDRWYSVFIGAVHAGWVHIKAEDREGKIFLSNEIHVQMNKNQAYDVKADVTCNPDEYLSIASIALDVAAPDKSISVTAQVKEGRLVVKTGGEVKATKIKPNTVVDLAVFPLVTILPRTEGYEIDVIELIKPKLPEAAALKFDKEETIEYGERKVKARRFMLAKGDGKDRFYYVDATNRLIRVHLTSEDDKDVDMTLSDEKRAKDIDTKD